MLANAATHEADFHAWTEEQAALLRAGRVDELDAAHVAQALDELGRRMSREFEDRLAILLLHLLRWERQPGLRGKAWTVTIEQQRHALAELLGENPSLAAGQDQALNAAHEQAVLRAELETDTPRDCFPWACQWSIAEVLDNAFWPEPD